MKKSNWIANLFNTIITSTAFGIICMPLTAYYTWVTWKIYRIESEALREAIEVSEPFYEFLYKTGFRASKWGTSLLAQHEYNQDMNEAETYAFAKSQMIKFISVFFESEQLLDVVDLSVTIDPKREFVTTVLKPAHYDVHFRNLLEFLIGLLLWIITIIVSLFVIYA